MPELPEVETIRRQLSKEVTGAVIRSVDVRFAGRLNVGAAAFRARLAGARILSVGRRAKLLLFRLSNGWTLVAHLKMTGRFLLVKAGAAPGKHVHLVFHLSGGRDLFFEDVRKFGYLRLFRDAELAERVFAKEGYGPEPLEAAFTPEKFAGCLSRYAGKRIKPTLMDQTCVAGIGNIYADEALWRARVRPDRRAGSLTAAETRGLYRGVLDSLRSSIRYRGTSADDYLDLYGRPGTNAPRLRAYGRGGRTCSRCGHKLVKVRLAGRGTHYCPHCQK